MIDTIVNSFDIWTDAQGIKSRTRINSVDNISLVGIAMLRELILDLAVSGKLVPQDPIEEPAFELLKKIELEKQLLVKEGKLTPQKKQLPISDEEKPFELSQSWEWVRLKDIGNIFNGNSIDAATKESKYTNSRGLPYIATKDVGYGWDILDYDNGISIPEDEINFKLAHKGSVLICAEGGSAGKKCGITNRDIYFGNKLFAIELFGNIPSNYILSNYLSSIFSRQFKSKLTGIIGGISIQKFNDIIIPLPPLSEQHRIVHKVDELMSLCDKLEAGKLNNLKTHQSLVKTLLATVIEAEDANELQVAWERMSAHFDTLFCTEDSIDQLKQTILQLAVMGKLVKQDSNEGWASELLEKIAISKEKLIKEGRTKMQDPLPVILDNEKPFQVPNNWTWCRLGEITLISRGSSPRPKGDPRYFSDDQTEFNWITISDITNYCKNNILYKTREYLTKEGAPMSRYVGKDEFIIAVSGSTTGKCCITGLTGYIYDGLASVNFIDKAISNEYFLLYMMQYYQYINTSVEGLFPNINTDFLKNLLVCIPPYSEQKRIVSKVDELFVYCDALKSKLFRSQDIQLTLSQTIVENAVS